MQIIVEGVPMIGKTIARWVDAFLEWFPPLYAQYLEKLGALASMVLDWLADRGPQYVELFLTEWVPAFVGWVAEVAVTIIPKMVELVATIGSWLITTGLPKLVTAVVKIGEAIGTGLVVAIEKMIPIIADAFVRIAQGGLDAFKRVLGIASPSAVMQAMGEYVVEGLANGIDGATEQATSAMDNLASAIGAAMPVVLNESEKAVAKSTRRPSLTSTTSTRARSKTRNAITNRNSRTSKTSSTARSLPRRRASSSASRTKRSATTAGSRTSNGRTRVA
jgi:hypothetical protein